MTDNIDLGDITAGPNWRTPDATFTMDGDHTYTATSDYIVNTEFYFNFGFTVTTTETVSFSVSAISTTIGPMDLLFDALVTSDSAAGTADGWQFNSTYDKYFTDGFSATVVPGSYVLSFHVDNSFGDQNLNFDIGQTITGAATLFTTGADTVDFNKLTSAQQSA